MSLLTQYSPFLCSDGCYRFRSNLSTLIKVVTFTAKSSEKVKEIIFSIIPVDQLTEYSYGKSVNTQHLIQHIYKELWKLMSIYSCIIHVKPVYISEKFLGG